MEPVPGPGGVGGDIADRSPGNLDDLAPRLDHLWRHVEAAGRDPGGIDVAVTTGRLGPAAAGFQADEHLEALDDMAALDITWSSTRVPGDSLEEAIEAIERYGAEVIGA